MKDTIKTLGNILPLILLVLTLSASCKKDKDDVMDPQPPVNEGEVITTIRLSFIDSAGVLPLHTATFRDPDGDGGMAPDIHDTIRLTENNTYFVSLLLLNETETPPDTISNEVLAEADEHIFCFTPSGADLNIVRTDSDGTYEIGLKSTWYSGVAGTGTVKVVLKHQPGSKDGSCTPGDTDIDVDFVTEIQ